MLKLANTILGDPALTGDFMPFALLMSSILVFLIAMAVFAVSRSKKAVN